MGTLWNRSSVVERYADDIPAAGALAYFYIGGTTTPLSVYSDAGEATVLAWPVVADANGRWPDVFIPYITSYDVRTTTADGVQLTYTLQIPNPNPVEVSTTTPVVSQVQTGMIHAEFVNTVKTGYVRLNGRTIGNASSLASERAHADTADLFAYLWNNLVDAIATVSTGRGGSAASDFAANKNIILPNCQGTTLIGLDDMGDVASGSFVDLVFNVGGSAIIPGSITGINSQPSSFVEVNPTIVDSVVSPSQPIVGVTPQVYNNLPFSRLVTWFIKL
jgi:hypothetical protein